ncbi:DNA topoisomerase IV [Aureisphaera galaxeae]|uniref:DNA topoisomerase IV n=1 Tax=Aureisphaera galaxeae TaxID=1538023 RepID=UPI002350CF0F|nr:DNA topoisomerase IV [Aureisphaera galaxeae]MDC8004018.1 DNA topoisomerase IV [Aureisphaera galaxeae]
MRPFFAIFFLFLLSSCFSPPERNCSDFKTGTFTFEALIGTEIETTTFVRNDSIEIDYFRGKADTSSIRWINDCEYIVKKINPKNMAEKKAVHIRILSTDNQSYTFEYGIVGGTGKEKGTAVKVK